MSKAKQECWLEFCELAAQEHDPNKLLALVTEINRQLLGEARDRTSRRCKTIVLPSRRPASQKLYSQAHEGEGLLAGAGASQIRVSSRTPVLLQRENVVLTATRLCHPLID